MNTIVCIRDLEQIAKESLDSSIFDFISGGSMDEVTLRENIRSYSQLNILPRVLTGAYDPDISINLLGNKLNTPILIAPMAFHKLVHSNGEIASAQAARYANTIMTISTFSTTSYKYIIQELSIPPWFQIYILKDRGLTKKIIEFAEQNGCNALIITVDASIYGKRERELRNPLTIDIELPDLLTIKNQISPNLELNKAINFSSLLDPLITWKDIDWIRSFSNLPIFIKGILRPEDAKLAYEHGAKGVIVSNHGGRQLDTTPTALKMLPKIKDAIGDNLDVFIDGGIRRGTDVLKAIALGAKATLIGRPILWGLANNGVDGVIKVFDILNQELKLSMSLTGCKTISDINKSILLHPDSDK